MSIIIKYIGGVLSILLFLALPACDEDPVNNPDADGDSDTDSDGDSDGDTETCQCSEGLCCDGCHFLPDTTQCSDEAVSHEFQCSADECGADTQRRALFRHCSGTFQDCPEDNLQPGDWETLEDCGDDQICESDGSDATCSDCELGCQEGDCRTIDPIVTAGTEHTCVVSHPGDVRCWGLNDSGQLGYAHIDTIGDDEEPSTAGDVDVGGVVLQISAGWRHTCALLLTGTIRCWGLPSSGALGYGNSDIIGNDETPASAGDVDVGGTTVQMEAAHSHTCALLDTGSVRCWGRNDQGQLGYGHISSIGYIDVPSTAGDVDVGATVTQVALGTYFSCALTDSGNVRCWGFNSVGQLGYEHTDNIGDDKGETPASAGDIDIGGTVVQVSGGMSHTCVLLDTGNVRCWGGHSGGRLGYPEVDESIGDNESPASVGDVDVGGTVVQVAAGGTHSCALLDTGAVRCWGLNAFGQLGYDGLDAVGDDETPASVGDVDIGGTAVHITTGFQHTCAFLDTGAVRCWGDGTMGRLGYSDSENIGDNETPASAGDVPFR